MKAVKDPMVDCLNPKTGCQEGGGRKEITLRIIELRWENRHPFHFDSMKVEEYEV